MKRFSSQVAPVSRKRQHVDIAIEAELALQQAQQELAELNKQMQAKEVRIRRLEADRAFLNERDDQRRHDYVDAKLEACEQAKKALEAQIAQLIQDQDAWTASQADLESTNRRLEHDLSLSQQRIEALERMSTETTQVSHPKPEIDTSLATPPRPVRKEDNTIIQQELSRQVKHIKRLELQVASLTKENDVHKLKHEAISLLKEHNRSLSIQVGGLTSLRRELGEAQERIQDLEAEKQRWRAFLEESDEFSTPQAVTKELKKVRLEAASLQERAAARKAALDARDLLIMDLESRISELEGDVGVQKEKRLKAEERARATDRQVRLIKQERDLLKEQLNTFSTEEQLMSPSTFNEAQAEQVKNLEALLSQHQDQVATLNAELVELRKIPIDLTEDDSEKQGKLKLDQIFSRQLQTIQRLQDELDQSNKQAELALKSEESLQAQLERYQEKLALGAYNSSTTKILSLADNPAAEDLAVRSLTLQCLRAENEALLASLRLKGENKVPQESLQRCKLEVSDMQDQLKNLEKLSERRLEAFRQKASDLRTAVSVLLGYNLDLKSADQIRLTSIYAPSKSHALLFSFEPGTSAAMRDFKLIGDGENGLNEVERRNFRFWANERRCWPGFLASVLLEQYESVTRGGKHLGYVGAS